MNTEQGKEKYQNYINALKRLEDAAQRDESDDLVLDAVIQRFEFTYELSWKLIKLYLSHHGIADVRTPREAFKEAFAAGLIQEGDAWIDMLDDRNLTSHTYNEGEAREIFHRIKNKYLPILNGLKNSFSGELS